MRFCVNCGTSYQTPAACCTQCMGDQLIPNELIDRELRLFQLRRSAANEPPFGYPGEATALVVATGVLLLAMSLIGVVSFGFFLLLLALNLVSLIAQITAAPRRMIQATEKSFPAVFKLAKLAAYRLQMPLPPVFVVQNSEYNAYTMGFGHRGFVVVHSALVRDFEPGWLLFVLGHELGHMKKFHTTWLTLMANASQAGVPFMLGPLVRIIFNVWSVKSEYTADEAGLIACRDPASAIKALLTVAGGPQAGLELVPEALLRDGSETSALADELADFFGTHPGIWNRLKHILLLSHSQQFGLCVLRSHEG